MLLDRLQLRIDDCAAVERADRQRDRQRFDQKAQPDGGPAGNDSETDAGRVQRAHGVLGAVGEGLVLGQQRAVAIGNNKCNAGHWETRLSWRMMSSTMISTGASIDTVMGRS